MGLAVALAVVAGCGSSATGAGADTRAAPDVNRFPDAPNDPASAALGGRVLDEVGTPQAGITVAACGDLDCLYQQSDARGLFLHDGLDPTQPRRVEIFGQYGQFGSVVFRRSLAAGALVDVGDLVLPAVRGAASPWPATQGGTVVLAGGALELRVTGQSGAPALHYPVGTTRFEVQAGRVAADALPPYLAAPAPSRWERAIAFALLPFDIEANVPVHARVLAGVNAAPGSRYVVYQVDTFVGTLDEVGHATVGADHVLETDPATPLDKLTFIAFVPED